MSAVMDRQIAAQDFVINPLSDIAGAEVIGLDLRRPLDAATRQAVYDAFVMHHVLAFRDQDLTKDEQVAFTEQFGTLERHVARNRGPGDHPLVLSSTISDRTASRAARPPRRNGTPTSRSASCRRWRRSCTRGSCRRMAATPVSRI
jgi:alpha-ketoglutarate-dependent taurine dioxygenase